MSALIAVQIVCDTSGCTNAYDPSYYALSSVGEARKEAHAEGWVSTGPRGASRRDYCPTCRRGGVQRE